VLFSHYFLKTKDEKKKSPLKETKVAKKWAIPKVPLILS